MSLAFGLSNEHVVVECVDVLPQFVLNPAQHNSSHLDNHGRSCVVGAQCFLRLDTHAGFARGRRRQCEGGGVSGQFVFVLSKRSTLLMGMKT